MLGENESFEEPGHVRAVPLGGTDIRHGLNGLVLRSQRRCQLLCQTPNTFVLAGECAEVVTEAVAEGVAGRGIVRGGVDRECVVDGGLRWRVVPRRMAVGRRCCGHSASSSPECLRRRRRRRASTLAAARFWAHPVLARHIHVITLLM